MPFAGKPEHRGKCWAVISRSYGAMYTSCDGCQKNARPGHLTCRWHADLEAEAQRLKAKIEKE